MSLHQLRTFLEVHRRRSLTDAARRLSLSQPAVSQQIASLETQLARPLFTRTRRGVVPTSAADELAAALGPSIDHAEGVLASMRARSTTLSGVVHLAGPAEYIGERFVDALARLCAAGLEIRIRPGGRDAIYGQLETGEVDLAVTASTPVAAKLDSARIGGERLGLVIAPSLAPREPAADMSAWLSRTPFCAYDAELPLIRAWTAENALPLPERSAAVIVPDLRMLLKFVEAGVGWSVLPDYLVADSLARGQLIRPFPDLVEPENALHLVWAKGGLRHPRVAHARALLLN